MTLGELAFAILVTGGGGGLIITLIVGEVRARNAARRKVQADAEDIRVADAKDAQENRRFVEAQGKQRVLDLGNRVTELETVNRDAEGAAERREIASDKNMKTLTTQLDHMSDLLLVIKSGKAHLEVQYKDALEDVDSLTKLVSEKTRLLDLANTALEVLCRTNDEKDALIIALRTERDVLETERNELQVKLTKAQAAIQKTE